MKRKLLYVGGIGFAAGMIGVIVYHFFRGSEQALQTATRSGSRFEWRSPGTLISIGLSIFFLLLPLLAYLLSQCYRPKRKQAAETAQPTPQQFTPAQTQPSQVPGTNSEEEEGRAIVLVFNWAKASWFIFGLLILMGSMEGLHYFFPRIPYVPSVPIFSVWWIIPILIMLFVGDKPIGRVAAMVAVLIIGIVLWRSTGQNNSPIVTVPSFLNFKNETPNVNDSSYTPLTASNQPRAGHTHTSGEEDPETARLAREILADQPDMLAAAIRESDLNQCERGTNGKTILPCRPLKGKLRDKNGRIVTNDATGVLQIRASIWEKRCKDHTPSYDINDARGNLLCGRDVIYATNGLRPWDPDPRASKILEFEFPLNNPDKWISLKTPSAVAHIDYDTPGSIVHQVDSQSPIIDQPNAHYEFGRPNELRFRTADRPTKMHVKYTYVL